MAKRPDLWFKFYPVDYIRSTRRLTLEQRGAYMDAIALQYIEGGPLPADGDLSWLAHQMHISTRKARVIVEELTKAMRLIRDEKGIYDERATRELEAREAQRALSAEAASKMQADRAAAKSRAKAARDKVGSSPARARVSTESATNQLRTNDEPETSHADLDREISGFANENSVSIQGGLAEPSSTCAHGGARLELEEEREEEVEREKPPNPPSDDYPPEGEDPAQPSAKGSGRSAESERIVSAAFDLWNAFATQHGFGRVEIQSPARRKRMAKRLVEIGGIEKFGIALTQVLTDDFLMGRVQPRDGGTPYRLTIEGLLSDRSGMGDVLARLIEKANEPRHEPKTKSGKPDSAPPKPFWWRGQEDAARRASEDGWEEFVRRWANGVWPVEYLGPPPGDPDCLVPQSVLKKLNLVERYGKGTHV